MSQYKKQLDEFIAASPDLIVRLSDFEFGDTIGKGGFGEVRRATQISTGRDCAIKTIFNERLQGNKLRRYLGEVATMSQCDNMFLVPFVGFTAEPPYAIVTEFMSNGSLDRFVRNRTGYSLSGTQLTAIAIGIAQGMIHLHKIGIIHRDLKAANIMLDSRLFPRIGDFGIARFGEQEGGMTAKIGTPNYMAPELITSHDYDEKVDVYSYAMILYEMTQSIRPFKSMKMNEIFDMVLKDDKRPPFYRPLPPPLQRLIEKCWATDPDERPSFEEISQAFMSGEVSFEGTRRNDIEKFIQTIKHDEIRRRILRERKEGKRNISSEEYTYYTSEDDDFQNFGAANDWHPKVQKKREEEEEYDEYEEEYYEEDEDQSPKTPMQILNDPKNPQFVSIVQQEANSTTQSTFFSFYKPLSGHLLRKIPPPSMKAIIQAFLSIMKRDRNFIPLFNQAQFFVKVPTNNPDIMNEVVACFTCLFLEFPKLIGQAHLPSITELLTYSPFKMLVLHSYYVKNLLTYNNPWPLLDNLLTVQKVMINKDCGYMYLALFSYLITKYDVYAKERAVHIRTIFLNFINSKVKENVKAAYDGLSNLYTDYANIDFTKINFHLKDPNIWRSALSLLIRIEDISPSPELIQTLLSLVDKSPKAWIPLLAIAETKKGQNILLNNFSWMEQYQKHAPETLRILLVLFKNKDNRSALANSPYFIDLLKSVINKKDKKSHTAAATVLRRIPMTQRLITDLEKKGFFKVYFESAIKSKKNKMLRNVLNLVDSIARVGYTQDYLIIVPTLISQLQDTENATAALTVIVTLSFHKQCAEKFQNPDLVSYFQNLLKFDEYRTMATTFSANLAKVQQ